MRPRVITGNIATIDGRIAASGAVPSWLDEKWAPITQAGFELIDFAKLHGATVVLEGSNSFVARDAGTASLPKADPSVNWHEDYLPADVIGRFERWMVVVDSRGRVAWNQVEGGGMHIAVLAARQTPASYLALLRERQVPYLVCGSERVELETALRRVSETFRTNLVVSTAGGVLNGALLQAGLVDEVNVQILPVVLGSAQAPAVFEGYSPDLSFPPHKLDLIEAQARPDGSVLMRFIPNGFLKNMDNAQSG